MERLKCRDNPIVTKLESDEFRSIFTSELEKLVMIFNKYNYEIRIAGGAVRDLLMGKKPVDIDFATTATPDQMKEMFETEKVRMLNMKGEKHGTITPRINDKENFEVTTLRVDILTDGRHAEVEYTTDWLLDANRRDLTINSMFLGIDGSVYDYFYGHDDLKVRRVAFVGEADKRIKEDYLRILRYFRFYGRVAENPDSHEEKTLKAIHDNVAGLERISGERIWSELKKILQTRFAGELVRKMHQVDVLNHCGLPARPNMTEFDALWNRSRHLSLQPVTLLAAMLMSEEEAIALNDRLKMSAYDRDLVIFIITNREDKPNLKPLLPYQRLVVNSKRKVSEMKEWVVELLKYQNSPLLEEFKAWEVPRFPVTGNMLKEKGISGGRQMGAVLNGLKSYWVGNDFKPSVEDILQQIPDVLSNLEKFRIK